MVRNNKNATPEQRAAAVERGAGPDPGPRAAERHGPAPRAVRGALPMVDAVERDEVVVAVANHREASLVERVTTRPAASLRQERPT